MGVSTILLFFLKDMTSEDWNFNSQELRSLKETGYKSQVIVSSGVQRKRVPSTCELPSMMTLENQLCRHFNRVYGLPIHSSDLTCIKTFWNSRHCFGTLDRSRKMSTITNYSLNRGLKLSFEDPLVWKHFTTELL